MDAFEQLESQADIFKACCRIYVHCCDISYTLAEKCIFRNKIYMNFIYLSILFTWLYCHRRAQRGSVFILLCPIVLGRDCTAVVLQKTATHVNIEQAGEN